jgi:hypothetical protein
VTDDAAGLELRAFLASYGATWGWSRWSCVCGVEGEAPTSVDACRALRVHLVAAHAAAGVQAQAMRAELVAALSDTPQ